MESSRRYLSLNPYELHKHLINIYVLNRRGSTSSLKRDTSRDKTDIDVIRENHKFLWEDGEVAITWEERLAKKYYDKLYKEFCVTDLTRYKENMFAMRWQTEKELVTGKGQFICGNKYCSEKDCLRSWEVNFGYIEHGEKRNALVKLRLCESCSKKLNYKHRRKEIKRIKTHKKNEILKESYVKSSSTPSTSRRQFETEKGSESAQGKIIKEDKEDAQESNIWKAPLQEGEEQSRDQEFEKYLEHLLL